MWREAEADGRPPSERRRRVLAATLQETRYELHGGRPERTGDCSMLDLNANAKGYVVDRAVDAATDHVRLERLTVNAGGDLRHRGGRRRWWASRTGLRPYDNEPPLATVVLDGHGMATSGRSWRVSASAGGGTPTSSTPAPVTPWTGPPPPRSWPTTGDRRRGRHRRRTHAPPLRAAPSGAHAGPASRPRWRGRSWWSCSSSPSCADATGRQPFQRPVATRRGRGRRRAWVIDVSAGALVLVSVTGLPSVTSKKTSAE